MIRREMVQELINESCDLLDNADPELFEPRDPDQPDALEHWQSMRPKPQPPPRQRSTTATVQADLEALIDTRVIAQFCQPAGAAGEVFRQALAEVIVIEGERHELALAIEVKQLRRELAAARAQIEALQGGVTSWSVDQKNFRVTPFLNGSTPGPTLDLRPLFEEYQLQTASD